MSEAQAQAIEEESHGEETSEITSLLMAFEAIQEQASNSIMKWGQTFHDSENFDDYYQSRLDDLIKKALEVEASLADQKALLKQKLQSLTKTLALACDSQEQ